MTAPLAGHANAGRFATHHNHDINVTPFVDVMLVLLIVFIIAAPLATTSLKLDLPPAHPGLPNPANRATVSIDAEGRIFVTTAASQDARTDLVGLAAALASAGPARGANVSIRADQRVRYGRFVAVLDQLQTDGYFHVNLIAAPPPSA